LAALIAPDAQPDVGVQVIPDGDYANGPTTANATPGATPSGIGTGFFINATDILTAAHVVADCGHVSLASGAPLRVAEMNEALDLALLSSPEPSTNWLVLGGLPDARLGERVFALGYPYAGILSSRLTVTGGNVSARDGILPDESRLMISAPIQPGNSGGPVLNKRGEVLGVVVSRLDELTVLGATGTLPQNMNFAVPPDAMMGFLADADVLFPARRAAPFLVEDGLPPEVEAAIVPLECH
jgi:serine protease Do